MTGSSLRTGRLDLRPLVPGDAAWLHRHWNDADVGRYLWDGEPVALDTVEGAIAQSQRDFAGHGWGLWLLLERDRGEPVGFCGLRRVPGTDLVEVLYSLEPARWGSGLATEVASAVLAHGWGAGLERIHGGIDRPNVASRRVLERLGMRPLGEIDVLGTPVEYHLIDRPARPGPSATC